MGTQTGTAWYVRTATVTIMSIAMFAAAALPTDGLLCDLDADKGVSRDGSNLVYKWENQAVAANHPGREFVERVYPGRPSPEGRPTFRANQINGHASLAFWGNPSDGVLTGDDLINMDGPDVYDHLTQGAGYTWVAVIKPYVQKSLITNQGNGGLDVNAFFGNLRNDGGGACDWCGLWGGISGSSDRRNFFWAGTRGDDQFSSAAPFENQPYSSNRSGHYRSDGQPHVHAQAMTLNAWEIVAARMDAGTGVVWIETFMGNIAAAIASKPFFVESSYASGENPAMMAIGTERDAENHPGLESFDGEIARFLIWERPLTSAELQVALNEMNSVYFDGATIEPPPATEMLIFERDGSLNSSSGFITDKPPSENGNWVSPVNFRDGTLHYKVLVRDIPTDIPNMEIKWNIWQSGERESCIRTEPCPGRAGTSVEFSRNTDIGLWHKDGTPIDFASDRESYGIHFTLGSWPPLAEYWDWGEGAYTRADLFPLDIKIMVVAVAAGATFSGWQNYWDGVIVDPPDDTLPPDIARGLIAHYPFEGNATEVTGNGSDGGVVGAATVAGVVGQALDLQSTAARVTIPHSSVLAFSRAESFSLSVWANPTQLTSRWSCLLAKSRDSSPWYGIWLNPDDRWVVGGPSPTTGPSAATGWVHVAVVQDASAGTRQLYLDGHMVSSAPASDGGGTGDLTIGYANSVDEPFTGAIDELRIYDRPLQVGEIVMLADQSSPVGVATSAPARSAAATGLTARVHGNVLRVLGRLRVGGSVTTVLYTAQGREVFRNTQSCPSGVLAVSIPLDRTLAGRMFVCRVTAEGTEHVSVLRVIR